MDQDSVASGPAGALCRCCGKPVPEGSLAWDYPVPDPVAFLSEAELARRTVFRSQRIISVTGLGNFICVILPVPVEHDREATLGIWLAIPGQREWQRVMDAGRQGGDAWELPSGEPWCTARLPRPYGHAPPSSLSGQRS